MRHDPNTTHQFGLRPVSHFGPLGLLLLTLSHGCQAGGTTRPLPEGPNVGGETGDPGVFGPVDTPHHTVEIVNENGDGTAPDCSPPMETSVLGDAARRVRALYGSGEAVLARLADGRLASAERNHGVTLIADAGDALMPGPVLLIESAPIALYPLSPERLVLVTERGVTLLDVSGDTPVPRAQRSWPGTARDSIQVQGGQQRAVYVVADEGTGAHNICGSRAGTSLHGVAVGADDLGELHTLELGRDLTAARLAEGRALLAHVPTAINPDAKPEDTNEYWRFDPKGPTELRLLSLPPSGAPIDHGTVERLPGVVARASHMRLRDNQVQVVSLEQPADEDTEPKPRTAHLTRLNLSEGGEVLRLGSCGFPWQRAAYTPSSYDGGRHARLAHLKAAVAVADEYEVGFEDGAFVLPEASGRLVRFAEDGTCPSTDLAMPIPLYDSPRLVAVGEDQLLAIGRATAVGGALQLVLWNGEVPADAPVHLELPDSRVDIHFDRTTERVFAGVLAAGDGAQAQTLVAVTAEDFADDVPSRPGIALVDVSADGMADLGRLPGMTDMATVGDGLYAVGSAALVALDLPGATDVTGGQGGGQVGERARVTAWANGNGPGAVLSGAVAQVAWSYETSWVELTTPVPAPHTVLSRIESAADANVFAIDGYLVLMTAETECGATEAMARLRVFDVADPTAPQEVGSVVTHAVNPCARYGSNGSSAWRSPAVGRRLVLRTGRGQPSYEQGEPLFQPTQTYAFHIIDLTKPEAPEVVALTRPSAELGYGSWVQGSTLYYSFGVQAGTTPETLAPFIATLDLEAEGALSFSEPINVPGDGFLVDGQAVYTRAGRSAGEDAHYTLHRTTVAGDKVTIAASLETGGQRATSGHIAGEHLFVTVGPPPRRFYGWETDSPTRLMVLDRKDLSLLGELALVDRSVIIGQLDGRLIVHARNGTMQVIDIEDPATPALLEERTGGLDLQLQGEYLYYRHGSPGPLVRWSLAR